MKKFFMICYDIKDERRIIKVSDTLENSGYRVQRSIFECYLDETEFEAIKKKLACLIDPLEDQVRYYTLCPKDKSRILVDGEGEVTRDTDFMMY